MPKHLQDLVKFRGDRLFNGAVNLDWFLKDDKKRTAAAKAFLFHGPKYHGVTQKDVGISHGHKLQDTASFVRTLIRRFRGYEDQPFSLAIAGYGTGKSHLALTLAMLLSDLGGEVAEDILQGLESADETIGGEIRALLQEEARPFLVIALNGMQNFDLTAELTRQVAHQVRAKKLDTKPLDDLRPRFSQAVSLIHMSSESVIEKLCDFCDLGRIEDILEGLRRQDEHIYERVQEFFAGQGMPIRAFGGESVRDVVDTACREYCGMQKPFGHLIILFDEFGRYTEFATVRSQIAGSGVLQDLFEAIQANAETVSFVGFIQFELNAYIQRVAPEFKNDILRYVTRYQSANKTYLSINLETLIAHLLEKVSPSIFNDWFDNPRAMSESQVIIKRLHAWFPQSINHHLWKDIDRFHTIIRKGCWPLSPYSTWFLFHIAAAGKHLQERSALSLLGDVFQRIQNVKVSEDATWLLSPVDLWTESLQQEFISSEEGGQQGAIAHAYASVESRYGSRLDSNMIKILRAVVLSSKMGLQVLDREDAALALCELCGLPFRVVTDGLYQLQEEYNVLEWDEGFKQFEILGDAVPRTQFLSFLRQRVASSYDEEGKAKLFASRAADLCDLLADLDCDFAEENEITTREWRYQGVTSNLYLLDMHLKLAADRWSEAVSVGDPRGSIIYCYVEQSRDPDSVASTASKILRNTAQMKSFSVIPILIVLLFDEDGQLGQALAEQAVLQDSLTQEDRVRFGNLIGSHLEKLQRVIRTQIESMIKKRLYISLVSDKLVSQRLQRTGTEIFGHIYKKIIPFPFDGFSTARGNAADTCLQLTNELLQGKLDFQSIIAKPPRDKNRAMTVLKNSWGIFTTTGVISRRPKHPVLKGITEKWDVALQSGPQRLKLGQEFSKLFLPPYGANIASAGLFLGVFLAPRADTLMVIQNGREFSVDQWLQNGVFRGKFLDCSKLEDVEFVLIGEASSEWEGILDEWEQAESYEERTKYLDKANELKEKIPMPPVLGYRYEHLKKKSLDALEVLSKIEKELNEALEKIERSYQHEDVGLLSWGTTSLVKIKERMISEKPFWTEYQIKEFQPDIDRARQTIIQFFPDWLARQTPRSDSPDAVGEFKHKMIRIVGGQLKKLNLDEEFQKLEDRTTYLVQNAETASEARQLIQEVTLWMDEHQDALRIIRIAEIRGLREVGKGFTSKLQGMARRIEMMKLNDVRTNLAEFLSNLKNAEDEIMKRASALWKTKLQIEEDLDNLLVEVETLTRVFEGCEIDLEDFRQMQRALQIYQKDYKHLKDERLTWSEFEALSESLQQEAESSFGNEELPWPPKETIIGFVDVISKQRKQASLWWIKQVESDVEEVSTMSAAEANRLHEKAVNPPPFITEQHADRAAKVVRQIEARLEALKIEWLVEKFKELNPQSKKNFLKIASDLSETI